MKIANQMFEFFPADSRRVKHWAGGHKVMEEVEEKGNGGEDRSDVNV